MEDPRPFALGDTQYIMVEFDHHGIPSNATDLLRAILSRGMVPIITHPERNAYLMKNLDVVQQFIHMGCLSQVTANAFTGFWGPKSKKAAEKLLKKKAMHIVATDAHDLDLRPPILTEARRRIVELAGADTAEKLVTHNPAAVVAGQSVAG